MLKEGVKDLHIQALSLSVSGSSSFMWESKLNNVKKTLCSWVKSNSKPAKQEKNDLLIHLASHQDQMEEEEVLEVLIEEEKRICKQIEILGRQEEEY